MAALPALVVSPHLDDAVFSCGQWLAAHPGTVVATVFAGLPPPGAPLTEWDARCGFTTGVEAMQARRAEDETALALLQARPVWLDFLDDQYGQCGPGDHRETPDEVAARLGELVDAWRARELLLPLGLFHADHFLAHEAALRAVRARPGLRVRLYEDVPYRAIKGLLQQRMAVLAQEGLMLTPDKHPVTGGQDLKRRAVACYASQVQAFGGEGPEDAWRPERLWTLEARADE